MSTTVENFAALGLSESLLKTLSEIGYETPSPIQAQCIPILLDGHDMIGMAQTGTGKTAAFALPLMETIDIKVNKPQALILTAIVISFSFFAFLLVLSWRAYDALGTDNTDRMRLAEPETSPLPPEGY